MMKKSVRETASPFCSNEYPQAGSLLEFSVLTTKDNVSVE